MTSPNVPAWSDHDAPTFPTLRSDVVADVCVVGLGGSGLSCIGELLRLGKRVVGVDAGVVGGGAAGRNGGFLLAGTADFYHDAVAQLGHGRARELYLRTIAEIQRIARETPDAVRLVGSLRLAASAEEEADCRAQLEAMRADELPVEPYEGPHGRGLFFPTDGSFQPLLRCHLLAERVSAAGAQLFEHSPAVEIRGDEVRTPEGRVKCQSVIVAVDGRLERLLPELEGRVRTARLQMLGTAPTDEVRIPCPVYARWGYDYWQQLPDGRVVIGGFRDHHESAEWTESATPSPEIQTLLERELRERVGVHAAITHRWAASVGYTDTALPVMEEARPHVWAIGGYSGTGNVMGALWGRDVARRAVGG